MALPSRVAGMPATANTAARRHCTCPARNLGNTPTAEAAALPWAVERADDLLVIDPGSFLTPPDFHGTVAVVITHEHADHWTPEQLRRVLEDSPEARIFGVTATPNRGDKKGLREVFDNVADQVRLGELIASGHLVPPRTFVAA